MTLTKRILSLFIVVGFFSCAGPSALFDYQQESKEAPSQINFENISSNADAYHWDFGDGTTSDEVKPSHRYLLSGKYEVILVAKKGNKKSLIKKDIIVDAPNNCLVEIKTNLGSMTFILSDLTPKHRDNFLKLIEEGYYEGTLFHRVINGFMVQGGDPDSKGAPKGKRLGSGGPSYKIDAEFNTELAHIKGALAAARQGGPINPEKKSSGSQFYIVQGKDVAAGLLDQTEMSKGFEYSEEVKSNYLENGGTPFLDQDYTVFGQLTDGFDILEKIASVDTDNTDRPNEDVTILKVSLVR